MKHSTVFRTIARREPYATTTLCEDSAAERRSTRYSKGRRFDSCTSLCTFKIEQPLSEKIQKVTFTPLTRVGTGKTYASAFAMRELGYKKVLLLVHRNQIAKQAIKSYHN